MKKRRRKTKKERKETRWQLVERVVAALERAVDPTARVEPNVKLRELSLGRLRQCDVVVRTGKAPRETLTIVEVQDRSRKVDIDKFRGWIEKMRQVGAQHLVCVSVKGFPKSVLAEARRIGPSVRLVTLTELERDKWPLNFAVGHVVISESHLELSDVQVEGSEADNNALDAIGRSVTIPRSTPVFEMSGRGRLSAPQLADFFPRLRPVVPARELSLAVDFAWACPPGALWVHVDGRRLAVGVVGFKGILKQSLSFVPIQFSSYTQVDHDPTLAWAARAVGVVQEREVEFLATIRAAEDGRLRVAEISVRGLQGETFAVGIQSLRPEDAEYFAKFVPVRGVVQGAAPAAPA